jgi:chemotaxis protein MotB
MSRRRKHPTHANHERWLVSYADFITLLFAFFVVLYATAQVDNKKVKQVAAAIQGGFQQMGVFSSAGAASPGKVEAAVPAASPVPQLVNDLARPEALQAAAKVPLSQVKKELEQVLGDELRRHEIEMRVVPDGLVVSLHEVGFFKSGDARPLPEAKPVLTHIAQVLADRGYEIRVEGHTDDVPIHNSEYKSNWELSTARATQVVLMMVEKCGFRPDRVSAAGYAQFRPIASNNTEAGRRRNRRVDLVIVSALPPSDVPGKAVSSASQSPAASPAGSGHGN